MSHTPSIVDHARVTVMTFTSPPRMAVERCGWRTICLMCLNYMPAGAKAHLDLRSRSGLSRLDAAFGWFLPHNIPLPFGAKAPQTLSQSGTEYFPTALAYLGNTHTHTQTHRHTHVYIYIHTYICIFGIYHACVRARAHRVCARTSTRVCVRLHTHVSRRVIHMYHPTQQWLTVFGGICFMLVDLIDFQNGKNEPDGARSVIGIIIVMSVLPNPFSIVFGVTPATNAFRLDDMCAARR